MLPVRKLALLAVIVAIVVSAVIALGLGSAIGLSIDYVLLGEERFQDMIVVSASILAGIALLYFRPWGKWSMWLGLGLLIVAALVYLEVF